MFRLVLLLILICSYAQCEDPNLIRNIYEGDAHADMTDGNNWSLGHIPLQTEEAVFTHYCIGTGALSNAGGINLEEQDVNDPTPIAVFYYEGRVNVSYNIKTNTPYNSFNPRGCIVDVNVVEENVNIYGIDSKLICRAYIESGAHVFGRNFTIEINSIEGDLNNDGIVDLIDFALLADNWLLQLD